MPDTPFSVFLDFFDVWDNSSSILNITQDGNFTARFAERTSQEDFFNQFSALYVSILIGLLLPTAFYWYKRRVQHMYMRKLNSEIQSIMRAQYSENQFLVLEKLWEQIFLSLSQDKIIETHYRVLNDKISVCYEEICIRKMNVLKSVEELSKLKDQIMDAFMKKILDESHYKILNDKILIYEQKIKDTKQELKS